MLLFSVLIPDHSTDTPGPSCNCPERPAGGALALDSFAADSHAHPTFPFSPVSFLPAISTAGSKIVSNQKRIADSIFNVQIGSDGLSDFPFAQPVAHLFSFLLASVGQFRSFLSIKNCPNSFHTTQVREILPDKKDSFIQK